MLSKCANPECSEQFRYLHQGKMFCLIPAPKAAATSYGSLEFLYAILALRALLEKHEGYMGRGANESCPPDCRRPGAADIPGNGSKSTKVGRIDGPRSPITMSRGGMHGRRVVANGRGRSNNSGPPFPPGRDRLLRNFPARGRALWKRPAIPEVPPAHRARL